jgi:serine protease
VAATDNRDRLATFSNYGAESVDLGAPGVDVASTYTNNNYVYLSGTSMAAPHVAGTAGLIANLYPHASVEDMVLILLGSARPLSSLAGKTSTGGMLDAFASLQNAQALLGTPPAKQEPDPVTQPDPVTVPVAPSNLTAANNRNSTATLQWQDNADNETGFVLEREKRSGGGRWVGNSQFNLPENTQTYTDNSGTGTFRYRIHAYNSAGSSPATEWEIVEVTRR